MSMSQPSDEERIAALNRSLTNVTPTEDQLQRIAHVREAGKQLGVIIISDSPNGRERSIALTHLEDCVMWAVKSIVLE